MSASSQTTSRRRPAESAPMGSEIPLNAFATLAEAGKRLQSLQIEAARIAVAENSLFFKSFVEKMAGNGELLVQWSALCQHKAQRYGNLAQAWFEIMAQSSSAMKRLPAASTPPFGGGSRSVPARAPERRVSANVISFPDRRTTEQRAQALVDQARREHAAARNNVE